MPAPGVPPAAGVIVGMRSMRTVSNTYSNMLQILLGSGGQMACATLLNTMRINRPSLRLTLSHTPAPLIEPSRATKDTFTLSRDCCLLPGFDEMAAVKEVMR